MIPEHYHPFLRFFHSCFLWSRFLRLFSHHCLLFHTWCVVVDPSLIAGFNTSKNRQILQIISHESERGSEMLFTMITHRQPWYPPHTDLSTLGNTARIVSSFIASFSLPFLASLIVNVRSFYIAEMIYPQTNTTFWHWIKSINSTQPTMNFCHSFSFRTQKTNDRLKFAFS